AQWNRMRCRDQSEISANSTIGGTASQASSRCCDGAPCRNALINSTIIGSHIQGSTNSASPPNVAKGANGWNRKPSARSPWKAKEAQPWVAFQISTGLKTAKAV